MARKKIALVGSGNIGGTLAHLIHVALKSGQPSFVVVNNKAEGCAPLSARALAEGLAAGEAPSPP